MKQTSSYAYGEPSTSWAWATTMRVTALSAPGPLGHCVRYFVNSECTVLVTGADVRSAMSVVGWYGYFADAEIREVPRTSMPSRSHPPLLLRTTGRLS